MSMQQLKRVAPHLQMPKWWLLNTSSGCCNSKLISKPELHRDHGSVSNSLIFFFDFFFPQLSYFLKKDQKCILKKTKNTPLMSTGCVWYCSLTSIKWVSDTGHGRVHHPPWSYSRAWVIWRTSVVWFPVLDLVRDLKSHVQYWKHE